MNSRGPLPQPDSRRGLSGTNNAPEEYIQETLTAPKWLKKADREEFDRIIQAQKAAGVGIREGDAPLYAQYVLLLNDFRSARSPKDRQAARRSMCDLEKTLVLGEKPRQQVGIRGKKAKVGGKLHLMLEKKAHREQQAESAV